MGRNKKRGKEAVKGAIKFLIIPILLSVFINWKVGLGFFAIISIIKIIKIKRRKYFMRDISGEEVGLKGFIKRWKLGIEGITPLQQAKTNILGTWITLTGVLAGMTINALVRMSNQWIWIEIILTGSLILIVVQMIGGLQKYWRFKEIDKAQKELEGNLNPKDKEKYNDNVQEIKLEDLSLK